MHGMLRGEPASGGRYYATHEVRNDPLPVQAQLPLLIGGGGEKRTFASLPATPMPATSAAASTT